MRPKGSPKTPGSGRKKGTVNKDSVPLREKAQALGIDPFEILLHFAAGNWQILGYNSEVHPVTGDYSITSQVRVKAAGDACEYLYPKLKQVEANIRGIAGFGDPCEGKSDEEVDEMDVS